MPKNIIPFHDNCSVFISSVLETLRPKHINYLSIYIESSTRKLYYSSCSQQCCLPVILEIRNSLFDSQKDFQYIMWDAFPFEKKTSVSYEHSKNILSIVIKDGQHQTIFSLGNNSESASIAPDFISSLEDLKDIALWTREIALRKEKDFPTRDNRMDLKKAG